MADGTVLRELQKLEEAVADLRAQTGVEAFELRARIRELERRLDDLTNAPSTQLGQRDDANAAARRPVRAKTENARKPTKAERVAARQQTRGKTRKGETSGLLP
jgi:acetyl-CoA carboxylase alpha subunit